MNPRRCSIWALPVAVVTIGVLLVGVLPTRTFLAQQASVHALEEQLTVLHKDIGRLEERVQQLNDPAEIEQIICEKYFWLLPAEEACPMLPPATPPPALPALGTRLAEPNEGRNPLEKAWDWLAQRF
ncbi:MAG: hypothetical protein M3N32_07610 [Actinomycetota bacterium]|nr:hypothetical protein [Actinomycetota bacterium]